MVYFSRWKIFLIVAVCVWGVLYAAPNFVNENTRQTLSEALPSWAPSKTVNLGLDLQGGSHLLLDVDVDVVVNEQIDGLFDEAKKELRRARPTIRLKRKATMANGFYVELYDVAQADAARKIIRDLDDRAQVSENNGRIEAVFDDAALQAIKSQTVEQSTGGSVGYRSNPIAPAFPQCRV